MTIKISAFPDAATPMAAADRVTGLQGGANANFSQAQILSGRDSTVPDTVGATVTLRGGLGNGSGNGGAALVVGGYGGLTGRGGNVDIVSGSGGANGGNGGLLELYAGYAYAGGFHGGNIYLRPGKGLNGATNGWLYLYNIPSQATSAGVPAQAIWRNSTTGALMQAP